MVAGEGVSHITQMAYLLYAGWLFLGSELLRKPLRRSSQSNPSTHFGE
jgi:hypothetical protein